MYCTHCGKQVPAEAAHCPACGQAQAAVMSKRRLARPYQGRKIAGVCLGVANYLDLDVTLVRVIWVILALMPVPFISAVLAYIVAWILMPNEVELLPAASPAAPVKATAPPGASPQPERNG